MLKQLQALLIAGLLPASAAVAAKPVCYDSDHYHVIAQDLDDGPGQRIALLQRSPGAPAPACTEALAKALPALAVPNESYAVGVKQHFLLLDQGTGPDGRQLLLWDLRRAGVVWRSAFDELLPGQARDAVIFWRPEKKAADEAHCPQLRQWRKESLTAVMEQQVRLSLGDLSVSPLGSWRCVAQQ